MRGSLLIVVLVAACGSKTPAPDRVAVGNTSADAGALPPNPSGCPASWADLQSETTCSAQNGCQYPEGSCYCGHAYPCTGVELPPDYFDGQPTTWQCTPTPPEFRADGCPGIQPNQDAACSKDGQQCSYGDCCVQNFSCEHGKWVAGMASCPP